jgi:hypothetical protein
VLHLPERGLPDGARAQDVLELSSCVCRYEVETATSQ